MPLQRGRQGTNSSKLFIIDTPGIPTMTLWHVYDSDHVSHRRRCLIGVRLQVDACISAKKAQPFQDRARWTGTHRRQGYGWLAIIPHRHWHGCVRWRRQRTEIHISPFTNFRFDLGFEGRPKNQIPCQRRLLTNCLARRHVIMLPDAAQQILRRRLHWWELLGSEYDRRCC